MHNEIPKRLKKEPLIGHLDKSLLSPTRSDRHVSLSAKHRLFGAKWGATGGNEGYFSPFS